MKLPTIVRDALSHRCTIEEDMELDVFDYIAWWYVKDDYVEDLKAFCYLVHDDASYMLIEKGINIDDQTRWQLNIARVLEAIAGEL